MIVVWECETKSLTKLTAELMRLIDYDKAIALQKQSSNVAMAAEMQRDYHTTNKTTEVFHEK